MSHDPVERLKRLAGRFRPHHVAIIGGLAVVGVAVMTARSIALPPFSLPAWIGRVETFFLLPNFHHFFRSMN